MRGWGRWGEWWGSQQGGWAVEVEEVEEAGRRVGVGAGQAVGVGVRARLVGRGAGREVEAAAVAEEALGFPEGSGGLEGGGCLESG